MIALSRWPSAPGPARSVVAFGREGPRSAEDLRRDVAALAAQLAPRVAEAPPDRARLLLHCEDAYAFAVGLLAAAQAGAPAVLPPSRQPGALRRLVPEVAGAVLDGDADGPVLGDLPRWHPLEAPPAAWTFRDLDRDAPFAELFTSGTTGAGRPAAKAVRHLEDEVAVLEAALGPALAPDTRILATVAPQHLYGLLFRVLWPLAAGRPFLRTPVLHPEELAPHAPDGPGTQTFAVATTPAALRHLVDKGALAPRASACRAVFSSGGPLGAALARRAARQLGAPPWEVYGSTETGGVAVRQQHAGGEPWRALPGVSVAATPDGCLAVTSPFVSEGEARAAGAARFVLGDRVALDADGGFALLGRADRVVKVGEKRLSLPDMEERLRAHPAVADVGLVALGSAAAAGEGRDTRVGAVVVPSAEGRRLLAEGGRAALAKALGEHLAPDFDRVLLPRAWRVADALPRDAQGKTSAEALRARLADGAMRPAAGRGVRRPEQLVVRREGRLLEGRLRIPDDLAFLEGHFPGRPVVAGVVQVHFAMHALEELLGRPPRLETLEALKFHELLLPGQEVRLRVHLEAPAAGGELRFAFRLEDAADPARTFSSGRGRVAPLGALPADGEGAR